MLKAWVFAVLQMSLVSFMMGAPAHDSYVIHKDIPCPSSLVEWADFQKNLSSLTNTSALDARAARAFECSQLESQAELFKNEKLQACLKPLLELGRYISEDSKGHEFEIPQIKDFNKALDAYFAKNPEPLIKFLEKIPGAEALRYSSQNPGRSGKERPALLIVLPQSDGAHIVFNVDADHDSGSWDAVVARFSNNANKKQVQFANLLYGDFANAYSQKESVDAKTVSGNFQMDFSGSNYCYTCHPTGYRFVDPNKNYKIPLESLLPRKESPPEILAAINKKLVGNYLRPTPPPLGCIGPENSKFRNEYLTAFLQQQGIRSLDRIQAISGQMNCVRCHDDGKKANTLCYPISGTAHAVVVSGRMTRLSGDVAELLPEERQALNSALEFEYFGQLMDPAPQGYPAWRGHLLDSILATPCKF